MADQPPGEGWSLPGYRVGQVLGRGGFSVVYQARQLSLGRDVAIKVLTTDLATEGDRRRFDREREALARLSPHPNVVDVIDAGMTAERRPFVVMRLYSGGTLADRLFHQGRLPVAEVTALVTKVASALDAAHSIGVIHRDVKPQNVLLTETGEPVLADFGIASILDTDRDRSGTSTAFFTLAHVAPEILEHHHYSVASDVYALASSSYQLLTGHSAFDPNDPRVGALIMDTPPPPIKDPGVPSSVADVVLAAMAKSPARRPPSAGSFAAGLAAAVAMSTGHGHATLSGQAQAVPANLGGAVTIPTPPPGGASPAVVELSAAGPFRVPQTATEDNPFAAVLTPDRPDPLPGPNELFTGPATTAMPGRRAILSALVLGAASLAAGTTVYLRTRTRDRQIGFLTGHSAAVLSVGWSPDGTLATSSADRTVRLWDITSRRTLGQPLTGHTGWVWSLSWSPDGKTLATAGGQQDMTVRLWDVKANRALGLPLTGHTAGLWSVAWSPAGDALATASNDRTARIWNPLTHQQVGAPLIGHTDGVWSVAWQPNGQTVATAGGGRDHTVRLWDPATHQRLGTPLTGHAAGIRAVAWSPDGKTLATGSTDNTVRLWDPTTHEQVGTALTGHTDWVNGLAWHPDGKTLATSSGDRTLRLWDVATARQLGDPLTGHTAGVRAVAWSPDGKTLASAGSDHSVRLWAPAG